MRKTVIVVGCGFAGSAAARELGRIAHREVHVIAYDKRRCLYNYPALPRLLNESLRREQIEVPLSRLFRTHSVDLRHERIEAVDPLRRVVHSAAGEVRYDYLVLAPGSRAIPLAQDSGIFVTYPKALRHLRQLSTGIDDTAAERRTQPNGDGHAQRIAVVGGGLTGVEFAMAIREAADRASEAAGIARRHFAISLYEAGERLNPRGPRHLSHTLEREVAAYGVQLALASRVQRVSQQGLVTEAGTEPADTVVCCIGSRPNLGIELGGLEVDTQGVPVDHTLRCLGQDAVFVIGDGMLLREDGAPRLDLRQAHHAAAQGRHVAHTITRLLRGRAPRPYRPRETPIGVMLQSRRGVFSYRRLCVTGMIAGRAKRWLELRHT